MLRVTDHGVEHRDPIHHTSEVIVPRAEARKALDSCAQAITAAGMLPSLRADLAKLRRFIETH